MCVCVSVCVFICVCVAVVMVKAMHDSICIDIWAGRGMILYVLTYGQANFGAQCCVVHLNDSVLRGAPE